MGREAGAYFCAEWRLLFSRLFTPTERFFIYIEGRKTKIYGCLIHLFKLNCLSGNVIYHIFCSIQV